MRIGAVLKLLLDEYFIIVFILSGHLFFVLHFFDDLIHYAGCLKWFWVLLHEDIQGYLP